MARNIPVIILSVAVVILSVALAAVLLSFRTTENRIALLEAFMDDNGLHQKIAEVSLENGIYRVINLRAEKCKVMQFYQVHEGPTEFRIWCER